MSRKQAVTADSASTIPVSGSRRAVRISREVLLARRTARCAFSSAVICGGNDRGGAVGDGKGRRRTYTAAPSTFCCVACTLFWTVMREVS